VLQVRKEKESVLFLPKYYERRERSKGGENNMSRYTVSMYLTIEAESEEEAREIADTLEVIPKIEDEGKIFWDSQNTEVEKEPF
jgi:hypothetical protein